MSKKVNITLIDIISRKKKTMSDEICFFKKKYDIERD